MVVVVMVDWRMLACPYFHITAPWAIRAAASLAQALSNCLPKARSLAHFIPLHVLLHANVHHT